MLRRLLATITSTSLLAAGCKPVIDTERDSVDDGSFGTTVVTLMCKRLAYLEDLEDGGTVDVSGDDYRDICRLGLAPPDDAPDNLKALLAERDDLIRGVDTVFPEAFLPALQAYLSSDGFLAAYDDDTASHGIDALIGLLDELAADDDATAALARLDLRAGYRPLGPGLGALRAAVRFPEQGALLLGLAEAVTEGGVAAEPWRALVAALGATLRDTDQTATPVERDDADRTMQLAVALLLGESDLLGTGAPIPLVRRDPRGVAAPAALAGPFVDGDADGLADLDAAGHYVDADGAPVKVPSPFTLPEGIDASPWDNRDELGRPLDEADTLLYRYRDLDPTVLAALARDGVQLMDPDRRTGLDLVRGASLLLGPRADATRGYGTGEELDYRGYDTAQSPLLDMAHAYLQLLRYPGIDQVLALARQLMVDHEPAVARLLEAVITTARLADAHPEAGMPASAPFWDDLVPVIADILSRPQLVEDLLAALERPEVKELGDLFRKQMLYKDRFDIDQSTMALVGDFTTEVDRTQPDSGFNRSIFERLLHLINDTSETVQCNKPNARARDPNTGLTLATYDECQLVRVDDMAVFYLQSIAYAKDGAGNVICENSAGDQAGTAPDGAGCIAAGRIPRPKASFAFNWGPVVQAAIDAQGGDAYLESSSGIAGFRTHPTPQAIDRLLFLDPLPPSVADTMDPAEDKDGDVLHDQHVGTLPVYEAEGFFDKIRPVLQAFADSDAEYLFVEIMKVLHKHWATADSADYQNQDPAAPEYVMGSGASSYEPLIGDMLAQRVLLDALVDLAPELNAITVGGDRYAQVVREAATFLLTPLDGLVNRAGVAVDSPWHLLADAYLAKQARLAQGGDDAAAWTDSVSELIDLMFRGEEDPTDGWRFVNRNTRGVQVAVIDHLRGRIARHDQLGDRAAWVADELPGDVERLATGPVFAAVADFVSALEAAPDTRDRMVALNRYLVDQGSSDETFRAVITAAADFLQLMIADRDVAPLARLAGRSMALERGWVDDQMQLVREISRADTDDTLATLLRQLFDETRPGRSALADLIDGIAEVHRARPFVELGQEYQPADYQALFAGLSHFLAEERRGLRKFIAIIKDRVVP